MAYMSQENKKFIAANLKTVMKQFPKIKYSLSVRHHMTLVMTISRGDKCLQPANGRDYDSVNTYHIDAFYNPEAAIILQAIKACMNTGNYDHSIRLFQRGMVYRYFCRFIRKTFCWSLENTRSLI